MHRGRIKSVFLQFALMIYDHFNERNDLLKEMNRLNPVFRFAVYVVSAIVVIALKVNNSFAQEFIYFKF